MNTEFQRIVRRDKKAFLSEQCKEIEENNRMGKTRGLFKKTGDIEGTFHARMGMIKDRNGEDLTETEEMARIHRTRHRTSWSVKSRSWKPQGVTWLGTFDLCVYLASQFFPFLG